MTQRPKIPAATTSRERERGLAVWDLPKSVMVCFSPAGGVMLGCVETESPMGRSAGVLLRVPPSESDPPAAIATTGVAR
jgi:hypothetical protein